MASLICTNMINKWLLALLFTRLNSPTLPNLDTKLPKLAPPVLINSLLILKTSRNSDFYKLPTDFSALALFNLLQF